MAAMPSTVVAAPSAVRIEEDIVVLNGLRLEDNHIARFLTGIPEDDRERTVAQAIRLGILCLERVNINQNVDFVKNQVTEMLGVMKTAVGGFGSEIIAKVGTEKGQVLEPVSKAVIDAKKDLEAKIKSVQDLLINDVDPDRKTSTVAKALQSVKDLVDPQRTDSIQSKLEEAIKSATSEKGAIATTVEAVVGKALAPLAKEVEELGHLIRGDEKAEAAAEDIIEQTTLKGKRFELEIVGRLTPLALAIGLKVQHLGEDNQPGDILVTVPSVSAEDHEETIIIECKDEASEIGETGIRKIMDECISHRNARAGIYLRKDPNTFAKHIREWFEGSGEFGPWIATSQEYLMLAIRQLRVMMRLQTIQKTQPQVDVTSALGQAERIRRALKDVAQINKKVTSIREDSEEISGYARGIKMEVDSALLELENSLRYSRPDGTDKQAEAA